MLHSLLGSQGLHCLNLAIGIAVLAAWRKTWRRRCPLLSKYLPEAISVQRTRRSCMFRKSRRAATISVKKGRPSYNQTRRDQNAMSSWYSVHFSPSAAKSAAASFGHCACATELFKPVRQPVRHSCVITCFALALHLLSLLSRTSKDVHSAPHGLVAHLHCSAHI